MRKEEHTTTYVITEPCIDVKDGSCVDVCPVTAIFEESAVPDQWRSYLKINAARVLLVEAAPRLLAALPASLAQKAQQALERLGVEVRTHAPVEQVDAGVLAEYVRQAVAEMSSKLRLADLRQFGHHGAAPCVPLQSV